MGDKFTATLGELIQAVTAIAEARGATLEKDYLSAEEYRYHDRFTYAEGSIGIDTKGQPQVTGELFKDIDGKQAVLDLRARKEAERKRAEELEAAKSAQPTLEDK